MTVVAAVNSVAGPQISLFAQRDLQSNDRVKERERECTLVQEYRERELAL